MWVGVRVRVGDHHSSSDQGMMEEPRVRGWMGMVDKVHSANERELSIQGLKKKKQTNYGWW